MLLTAPLKNWVGQLRWVKLNIEDGWKVANRYNLKLPKRLTKVELEEDLRKVLKKEERSSWSGFTKVVCVNPLISNQLGREKLGSAVKAQSEADGINQLLSES